MIWSQKMNTFIEKIFFIHDSQLSKKYTLYSASVMLVIGIILVVLAPIVYFYFEPLINATTLKMLQNTDFLVQYADTVAASDRAHLIYIAQSFSSSISFMSEHYKDMAIYTFIIGVLSINFAFLSRKAYNMSHLIEELKDKE